MESKNQHCALSVLRVPYGHDSGQIPSNLDAGSTVVAAGALTPHGMGEVYLWSSDPAPPLYRGGQASAAATSAIMLLDSSGSSALATRWLNIAWYRSTSGSFSR